jgi:DNA (cytosine-5)-methyltransferase 1
MKRRRSKNSHSIVAADMFCGAAGLSYGLIKQGIDVKAGVDVDESCRWVYEHNTKAKFILSDVADIKAKTLRKFLPSTSYTLLAGCAPCQNFSKYTQKSARAVRNRWRLVDSFGRIADEIRPDILTMENVPGLLQHRRFKKFIKTLECAGYYIWYEVIDCHDYGTPQIRRRLVLLASRLGPISLLAPEVLKIRKKTVRDAIGRLPRLRAGHRHARDPLHRAQALTEINQRRIVLSKPGKSWREWPEELRLECHKKVSGDGYLSVYGRMEWDSPAPTITTNAYNYGSGRFGHPSQKRPISLREAAMLQSFPRNYRFFDRNAELDIRTTSRLIGNAVPVALAKAIGKSIKHHILCVDPNSDGPQKLRRRIQRAKQNAK